MRKAFFGMALGTLVLGLALATTATGSSTSSAAIPGCKVSSLNLLTSGTLTLGTDNPAYPPWWGGTPKNPWKVSNPSSGKGYESAVAYAIAKRLGFARSAVKWTPVPFLKSYAPGKKPFDFYLAQVSYKPVRAKAVDFSNGYFDVNQAVVAFSNNKYAHVKTVAALKGAKIGVPLGTTSYDYVVRYIKPVSYTHLTLPDGVKVAAVALEKTIATGDVVLGSLTCCGSCHCSCSSAPSRPPQRSPAPPRPRRSR